MINNGSNKRVVWMMDETIANTHPANWDRVTELEGELVGAIGNSGFVHEIVHPIPCLKRLADQLRDQEFSVVFDLTGWLTPAMRELFPDTPVESSFSLSRVRVVSSPRLETTGYKISMSPEEIGNSRDKLDLSKPLIVDDVSFSGWTSRKTMDIWGINPANTTHAFLIANEGNLGNDPGAKPMLESIGGNVVSGYRIHTPEDDGWHLKDLHQNPKLEQAFILALFFQEAVRKGGIDSELARTFFSHETVMHTVFPDHLRSDQIRDLMSEGRFILRNGNVIEGDEVHARNPFLWASPYFQEHINLGTLLDNKDSILGILTELRSLTSDPEGKKEAELELQREVAIPPPRLIEGAFAIGKERL